MIFMFLWFGSLPHVPPAAIGIMGRYKLQRSVGEVGPSMVTKLNFSEVCSASLDLLEIFGVFWLLELE